jgi:hypothetical protein
MADDRATGLHQLGAYIDQFGIGPASHVGELKMVKEAKKYGII